MKLLKNSDERVNEIFSKNFPHSSLKLYWTNVVSCLTIWKPLISQYILDKTIILKIRKMRCKIDRLSVRLNICEVSFLPENTFGLSRLQLRKVDKLEIFPVLVSRKFPFYAIKCHVNPAIGDMFSGRQTYCKRARYLKTGPDALALTEYFSYCFTRSSHLSQSVFRPS